MAVKIRLARIGTKNAPIYRIVAADTRRTRDGKNLEILGVYNPTAGTIIQLQIDRIQAWLTKGALMTDAVKRIHKLHGKKSAPTQ
jgi:small subunit ribosomal protein S16